MGEQVVGLGVSDVHVVRVKPVVAVVCGVDELRVVMDSEVRDVLGYVLRLGADIGVVGRGEGEAQFGRNGNGPFRAAAVVGHDDGCCIVGEGVFADDLVRLAVGGLVCDGGGCAFAVQGLLR